MSDKHQSSTHEPWGALPQGFADHLHTEAKRGGPVTDLAMREARSVLDREPTAIVDLGPGTGIGSVALAKEFGNAHVQGVDISEEFLERCQLTIDDAGMGDRFSVHEADLSSPWSSVVSGPVDVVWAALSLHHVSDPAAALREAFAALRPGGVLVLIELPASTHSGGANESHRHDHHGHRHAKAHSHQHPGTRVNWKDRLVEAGFTIQRQQTTTFDMDGSVQNREIWIATR